MSNRLAIVGAGVMGSGIAQTAISAGWTAVVQDVDQDRMDMARTSITSRLDRAVAKGSMPAGDRDAALAGLSFVRSPAEFGEVSFVIEAAPEELGLKQAIMSMLEHEVGDEVVLGTNTSSLSITEIAEQAAHPERIVGIHFFNPAPVMGLIEVIPGRATTPQVVAAAKSFAVSLGKTPVVAIDRPGFLVSRILDVMVNEAIRCVMDGNDLEDVDTAMRLGANLPIGPLALADLMGLDVLTSVLDRLADGLGSEAYRPAPLLRQHVADGRLGRKSGRGFYDYPPG
jgi:3-hydroxybutyryl-CoA dehydrogenase